MLVKPLLLALSLSLIGLGTSAPQRGNARSAPKDYYRGAPRQESRDGARGGVRGEITTPTTVVRQLDQRDPRTGAYDYAYTLSDGTRVEQSATVDERGVLSIFGFYEWLDRATGQIYRVEYVSDENGYQPRGRHLPAAAGVRVIRK